MVFIALCQSFQFNAFFRGCPAGHYVLRWRVQLSENFSVPSGLRFRVDVNYGVSMASIKRLNGSLYNAGCFTYLTSMLLR